jgi:signal transduction histidine kinase
MRKKIFVDFIKDKLGASILFFTNSICIIAFYYLTTGRTSETAYPLLITSFIYIVYMLYEWARYSSDPYRETGLHTLEQKRFAGALKDLHDRYEREKGQMKGEMEDSKHFISQWIHNMKSPVSVISLILQKYENENNLDRVDIEKLKQENNRLHSSLDSILNMLRLEEFSRDYVPEAINISDAINKAVNNRKNQFIYNNVFPVVKYQDDKMLVLTDGKWNLLLIEQILSNAIKYSKKTEGSKHVYIDSKREGEHVVVAIRDEGIGIPEYDLKRIFDPFFTGENGRGNSDATGIGLYISSVIAKKLGHDISVESRVGEGTTFRIRYLSKL